MLPTMTRAAAPLRSSTRTGTAVRAITQNPLTSMGKPTAAAGFSTTPATPAPTKNSKQLPPWAQKIIQKRITSPASTSASTDPQIRSPRQHHHQHRPSVLKTGTVVSIGKMQKTVTVSEKRTQWDKHIRKDYPLIVKTLVSDPRDSLREGDVIQFSSGHPKSRRVSHVVERIVAPFGTPLDQRPAVMTAEEREGAVREKREKKDKKRMGRVEEWLKERVGEEEAGRILGSEGEREAVWEELRMGREKRLVRERLAAEGEAESGR